MRIAKTIASLVITAALFTTGCVGIGWNAGPGGSCADRDLFVQPPLIEQRTDGYYVTWTQGSYPYFFMLNYEVIDDRLVFWMAGTSSTGNARRYREQRIEGAENVRALELHGAYWWEPTPDGRGQGVRLRTVLIDGRIARGYREERGMRSLHEHS